MSLTQARIEARRARVQLDRQQNPPERAAALASWTTLLLGIWLRNGRRFHRVPANQNSHPVQDLSIAQRQKRRNLACRGNDE